jgi:diguanylate cyclase (GGDEF)-like protein
MARTTRAVGRPIVFTSLTVGLGFSVLLFSSFVPTIVFGFLMLVTVCAALVGDLFILAAILLQIQLVTLWDLLKLKLGKDPRKGIPLFDGLSRSQVHYILMAGALREYHGAQILFRKGEISDSMYAIISGQLEVVEESDPNAEGKPVARKLISTLNTGDLVGEMGVVRHCERSATVVATKQTELLEINERMIRRLQWLYPPAAQKFFFNLMTMICNRLEETTHCLSQLKTLDAVTGLHDRTYFESILDKEIVRARRYNLPLSILMMQLDPFPELSPPCTREAGDLLLSQAARILKKSIRISDTACRVGGDQLGVVLPSSAAADTRRTSQRLRALFDEHRFEGVSPHLDVHLTVSIGFVELNPHLQENTGNLMDRASRALGQARRQGGNRVEQGV